MSSHPAQRAALVEGALVRRAPELTTLVVVGPDRQSWLNGLITSDLKGLGPGAASYGFHVAKNGRIQAELWVVVDEERLLVGVGADRAEHVQQTLDHYLIMEDAELTSAEPPLRWLFVYGPRAEDLRAVATEKGAVWGGPVGLGTMTVHAAVAPEAGCDGVVAGLLAVPGATEGTESGWEQIRLEHALPRYGVDFEENYPQEAAMESVAVSFNKGCYLGQEAVFMLEKRGKTPKRLVKLQLEGADAPAPGTPIATDAGEKIGEVTSAGMVGEHAVALGMVKRKHICEDLSLLVDGRPGRMKILR